MGLSASSRNPIDALACVWATGVCVGESLAGLCPLKALDPKNIGLDVIHGGTGRGGAQQSKAKRGKHAVNV